MKILFLDVDGVLNCATTKERTPDGYIGVCREKAAILRRIIAETGARIVLSSEWRRRQDNIDHLFDVLGDAMKAAHFGNTPRIEERTEGGIWMSKCRGDEIHAWLNERLWIGGRATPESFVILDDRGDMEPHMDRLVQTSYNVGLTDEIADRVIAMLNGTTVPDARSTLQMANDNEL